ncbi:MAG: oxidoreductase [Segniliparus sp.]|uniref:oxidoreductase n=1 Tax=Segniliparus sp. TaxID=2804064 RepID=UPI003F2F0EDD
MIATDDPLAGVLALPGVAESASAAQDSFADLTRKHLRGWEAVASETSRRAARCSALLEGASLRERQEDDPDPLLAGAVRVAEELARLRETWRRAPLQVLARLHTLAAADLDISVELLGRPRTDPEVGARLSALAGLIAGGTKAPAPVLAAIVHGELFALAPFGSADGLVARAASRLTLVATGSDPRGLALPESFWLRSGRAYRQRLEGYAAGAGDGVRAWILYALQALIDPSEE